MFSSLFMSNNIRDLAEQPATARGAWPSRKGYGHRHQSAVVAATAVKHGGGFVSNPFHCSRPNRRSVTAGCCCARSNNPFLPQRIGGDPPVSTPPFQGQRSAFVSTRVHASVYARRRRPVSTTGARRKNVRRDVIKLLLRERC